MPAYSKFKALGRGNRYLYPSLWFLFPVYMMETPWSVRAVGLRRAVINITEHLRSVYSDSSQRKPANNLGTPKPCNRDRLRK